MLSWLPYLLLSIALVSAAELIKIPLFPIQRDVAQNNLRSNLAKRAIGYAPLVDHVSFQGINVDVSYLGLVSIGTPPQNFLVDIDTGSGILWVADRDCRGCNVSTTHLFDSSLSSTIQSIGTPIGISYGIGAVICKGFSDVVQFGTITMDNFTFGSCYGEQDQFYPESIGILGIGFPHSTVANSWIVEAYQRSLIPAPAFSLSLGRYTEKSTSDGSLMVIGGYDESLVDGAINWIKCSATVHAQIPLDGIIVNGVTIKRVDNQPMQAIIDSGTGGFIPGPTNIVKAIYAQIPGAQPLNDGSGAFEFPCSSSIQIGFQFAGQNYMMDPNDFILQEQGGACIGALVPMDFPDDTLTELVWILGALFMKNVVSVFDLGAPAVGFGRLKETTDQYGSYTVVDSNEATALGTGPSATFSPTFNPPTEVAQTINIAPNPVTAVLGTGPVSPNLAFLTSAKGISTSAGASVAVTSDVPTTARVANLAAGPSDTVAIVTTDSGAPVVTLTATITAGGTATPSKSSGVSISGSISSAFIFVIAFLAFIAVA